MIPFSEKTNVYAAFEEQQGALLVQTETHWYDPGRRRPGKKVPDQTAIPLNATGQRGIIQAENIFFIRTRTLCRHP
ncbi:MAG: hypothetical protein ACOY4H_06120 [Thermodesulfobacteriota bacterium]